MRQLNSTQARRLKQTARWRAAGMCGQAAALTAWDPEPLTGDNRHR